MRVLSPSALSKPFVWLRLGLVLALLGWSGVPVVKALAAVSKEYQVKAVFLFNFAQFVKWPSAAFHRADEPFQIGILGDDPFDAFLYETVRGEKIDGHPLIIRRYSRVEDIKGCQILFVSRSESGRMQSLLAGLRGRNILTVGDTDGFIQNGGVVGFFIEKNKIRFRISLEGAKRAHLSISSKVLRLAEIAEPGKD